MFTGRDNFGALALLSSLHVFSLLPKYLQSIMLECYRVLCFGRQLVLLSLPVAHREHSVVILSLSAVSSASVRSSKGKHFLSLIKKNKKVRRASYTMLFLSDYNPNQNMSTHFITQWRQPRFTKHDDTLNQPQFVVSDKSLE